VKRRNSDVGRRSRKKAASISATVMPADFARSARSRSVFSVWVGPGSRALTVTPVPASSMAKPRETASWAVLLMP
jgi:hypothetical protein